MREICVLFGRRKNTLFWQIMKQKEKNLGEPLRELRSLASGYPPCPSGLPFFNI
jgi:hypothetical protein